MLRRMTYLEQKFKEKKICEYGLKNFHSDQERPAGIRIERDKVSRHLESFLQERVIWEDL